MNNFNFNSQTSPWFSSRTNEQQPTFAFANPFVLQVRLQTQLLDTMLWHQSNNHFLEQFYVEPVHRGMASQQQRDQYQAPTPGPSRNRRGAAPRKAEVQTHYTHKHELPRAIAHNRPVDIVPGHSWIDASGNTRAGRAWRPLSWNPSAVDGNSGRQIRKKPYHRRRSGKAESRRYGIDISAYEVPVIDPESTLNSQSILYRSASTPSAPTPAPSTSAISAQYLWFHLRLQHRHQYPHGPWSL